MAFDVMGRDGSWVRKFDKDATVFEAWYDLGDLHGCICGNGALDEVDWVHDAKAGVFEAPEEVGDIGLGVEPGYPGEARGPEREEV